MENFEEMFEESLKSIKEKTIIEGEIISISDDEIIVNIGYKADGIISKDELSYDESETTTSKYKVGDKVNVFVLKLNDGRGNVVLSLKRLEDDTRKEELETIVKNDEIITSKVTEILEKGVRVNFKGIRIFIPGSQLIENDINFYQGKTISFKIIENERNRIIGSEKKANREVREKLSNETMANIKEGDIVKGIVRRINDYGAFVDIGGVDGLLHASQMTWKKHIKPADFVREGQKVEVEIMTIDKETNRIALKMKKEEDNPWNKVGTEFKVGTVLEVTVTKLVSYGAFVEIVEGLDGFIHISQISTNIIEKPGDVLKEGQEVEAKIVQIDLENQKIELSIKALQEGMPNNNDENIVEEEKENIE